MTTRLTARFSASLLCTALAPLLLISSAQAHFIWVVAAPDNPQQVRVVFAEAPEPGASYLVDKIASTKVTAGGKTLKLEKVIKEDEGWWQAKAGKAGVVTAQCDYGVYKGFLLKYYAKHQKLGEKASAKPQTLDIHATRQGNKLTFRATYQGEPLAGAELSITRGEDSDELTTDEKGVVAVPARAGEYAVRTSHVQPDSAGDLDGKEYKEIRHYATLTCEVSADKENADRKKADNEQADTEQADRGKAEATELLKTARANRAVWRDFPGFRADLRVNIDGQIHTGALEMRADGDYDLKISDEAAQKWLKRQLWEVGAHRLPNEAFSNEASFVDQLSEHPLGRRLKLAEDAMGSEYRVKDDHISQVNRMQGPMRFTISVLDVARNQEGLYLPKTYTVSFWNGKTGELAFTRVNSHKYVRIGDYDLPQTIREVESAKDKYVARSLTFENHKLLPKAAE